MLPKKKSRIWRGKKYWNIKGKDNGCKKRKFCEKVFEKNSDHKTQIQICWDDHILQGGWIPTMWEDVCLPFEAGRKNILWGFKHFHENLLICQLISNELKFQISKRSELSLRRYLQINFDFLKALIFNVISISSQFCSSKVFQSG